MNEARARLRMDSRLQMLFTVLIVGLANLLASRHFIRLDVSKDRLYSLDEASKSIVHQLDRPLVVKVYFTPGLGAPYQNHEQFIRDKLDEYQAYAGTRMTVQVVDPDADPTAAAEAQKYGIGQLQYTVREQDRSELRKIWMGAVLLYGEKQEVLPELTNLASFEYDVSSAIHRLEQKADDKKVLAWSIGHGEPDFTKDQGPVRSLAETLSRRFVLRQVPLGGAGTIPDDVDALLVVGPQEPLEERALYQIDQLVMRGGAAAIFVTNTRPDMRTLRSTRVISGLDPLLGHYGVQVNHDIVLDRVENGAMRFPVRVGQKVGYRDINYPLIPKADDLSRTSVLVAGLDSMLFPFASSLSPAAAAAGVTVDVLAQSTRSSGSVADVRSLDPSTMTSVLPDEKRGPFPLLVALTGSFRSFFETRPVPQPVPGIASVSDEDAPKEAPLVVEGAPTRLVVAGSADVIANNSAFMLNLCDWLVQDESLIGIRSKIASLPSLNATTPGEQLAWKAFLLLAGPALLFGYGGLRLLRYRRRARLAAGGAS